MQCKQNVYIVLLFGYNAFFNEIKNMFSIISKKEEQELRKEEKELKKLAESLTREEKLNEKRLRLLRTKIEKNNNDIQLITMRGVMNELIIRAEKQPLTKSELIKLKKEMEKERERKL
ncbi:MAG: hypothetical protein ACTSP4_00605 [Candidatus Hodarchaeales archaeon]